MGRRYSFHSGKVTANRTEIEGEQIVGIRDVGKDDTTARTSDYIIGLDTNDAVQTVTVPNSMIAKKGRILVVNDTGGNAGTNAIQVEADCDLDGTDASSGTDAVTSNYGSVGIYSDGSNLWTF